MHPVRPEQTRAYISAKFLLAAPPPKVTVTPALFPVTYYPAKSAHGIGRNQGGAILGGTSPRWSATKF